MKITINNEEVLCDKDFKIEEEMLNTSSVILNNVYPKTWEQDKDYTSRFYYPPDYSKCKIFNEIYHPEEKSTASGTSFTLNNVDLIKQYELTDLKGQTTQSGTPTPTSPQPINTTTGRQEVVVCGKNLFDKDNASVIYNAYINGTTGQVVNGGTSSIINYISVQPNTLYSLTASGVGRIAYYGKNHNYLSNNTTQLKHFTTPNDTYFIRIQLSTSTLDLNTIQLELGNQQTTYEEYKGNTYEINLGKNILPYPYEDTTKELYGITFTDNGDGSITVSGTATGNATFALLKQTSSNASLFRQTLLSSACFLSGGVSGGSSSTYCLQLYGYAASGSGTLRDTGNGVSLSQFVNQNNNFNVSIFIGTGTAITTPITFYPMVHKGTQPTTYAPYKTPIELCKIGNYQDKIYKQNGNWYIYKEIGKKVLIGTENWVIDSSHSRYSLTGYISDYMINQRTTALCNYYKYGDTELEGYFALSGANNVLFIHYPNSSTNTVPLFKTWLSTHNTEVYYVLNTPTTTLIEDEELINQLESIRLLSGLNNVSLTSPNLPFIMDLVYNYQEAYTEEDMLFCGVVENTGNISLNPREPHYCNLQVLDFKTFLSEGETLDFVIYEKTILEAIDQVIGVIQPYGFVKGNVNILHGDDVIGAYSTKDKTAYDVFNYLADITQSRWTTRMIDEDTVAIDFYDPTLMPQGTAIQYNNTWFCNNNILDMSFSYSSRDYRNKQVMLSGEVYANIETTEVITADGYQTQFNTTDKIGYVSSILLNGTPTTIITKEEYDLGYEGDFYYQPGNPYFESDNLVSAGAIITIVYYAVIEGREVLLNQVEVNKINSMTNRKGVIARYETRNDATTTQELNQIGQSYLKYKGSPEVSLKVISTSNIWNIGERVQFTAPLDELTTEYMVKKKTINYITTQENIFYTFELSSSFNSETEINYFDNQRAKTMGNIGAGEFISRNIDIENTANVVFYDLEVNEVQVSGDSTLQSELQTPLGVE